MTPNVLTLALALVTRLAALLETQVSSAYGTLVSTSILPTIRLRHQRHRLLLLLQPARRHLMPRALRPPLILQARLLNLQSQLHQMLHREERRPTLLVLLRAPLLVLSSWEVFWELPFSP